LREQIQHDGASQPDLDDALAALEDHYRRSYRHRLGPAHP
jgi:hypothetical protein